VKIQKASASPKATRAARAFEKLLALGYRLITVIRKNGTGRIFMLMLIIPIVIW